MSLHISITDLDLERGICRISIRAGNLQARSYPQSLAENFKDLHVNRKLLSERRLGCFFIGDEPLLRLDYLNDEQAIAYIFQETSCGAKKIVGEFSVDAALLQIDGIIMGIDGVARFNGKDRSDFLNQVSQDFDLGVYETYSKSRILL